MRCKVQGCEQPPVDGSFLKRCEEHRLEYLAAERGLVEDQSSDSGFGAPPLTCGLVDHESRYLSEEVGKPLGVEVTTSTTPDGRALRWKNCRRGHQMTKANTYVSRNGKRHCRRCRADRAAEGRARRAIGVRA